MTKTKTQQDIYKAIAKLSKIDPLVYAFVLTAVDKYSEGVLADEDHTLKVMENTFIAGEAWLRTAKEVNAALTV